MTEEDLRQYFAQFGEVRDVFLPRPFRAFAFVTFADPEVAHSLCGDDHIIKGTSVHISCATPKNVERFSDNYYRGGSTSGSGMMFGGGGRGFGGRGGGRGGQNGWGGGGRNSGGFGGSYSSMVNAGYGMGNSSSGGFQMNPAMMAAAAQAALAQGLLGMMNHHQGSGGMDPNFASTAGNQAGGAGNCPPPSGNSTTGGGYGSWSVGAGGGDTSSQNTSWNNHSRPQTNMGGGWN